MHEAWGVDQCDAICQREGDVELMGGEDNALVLLVCKVA